jgi:hypothetical protein
MAQNPYETSCISLEHGNRLGVVACKVTLSAKAVLF